MLDVILSLFLTRAVIKSVRRRWLAGVGLALLVMSGWLLLVLAGWQGRDAERLSINGAWMLVMLGPSSLVGPSTLSPLADLVGTHALAIRLLTVGVGLAAFVLSSRRANLHSPLSDDFSRWSEVSLSFLPPALMLVGDMLVFGLASLLLRPRSASEAGGPRGRRYAVVWVEGKRCWVAVRSEIKTDERAREYAEWMQEQLTPVRRREA